jgi:hypothetical protein
MLSQFVEGDIISAPRPKEIGTLEANTILVGLNLLFLSFVLLQLQHLFGGDVYVGQTLNLSYADYAKNGFYQLLIATGCVIPLLLVLDWLCVAIAGKSRALFNVNTCLLLLQVGVMLASAAHRLMLYVDAYGMSTQRVYGAALLLWIAGLLLACGVLLLSDRRNRYAGAAWAWSVAIILCLHAVSPDALTMRINLERAAAGKEFDMAYALTLSPDSVPVVLANFDLLVKDDQYKFLKYWRNVLDTNAAIDFRSWNYAQWEGRIMIEGLYANLGSSEKIAW